MKRYHAIIILTIAMLISVYVGILLAENNVLHSLSNNQEHLCLGMLALE